MDQWCATTLPLSGLALSFLVKMKVTNFHIHTQYILSEGATANRKQPKLRFQCQCKCVQLNMQ